METTKHNSLLIYDLCRLRRTLLYGNSISNNSQNCSTVSCLRRTLLYGNVIGESNDDIDSMFKKNIVVWKLIDVVDVDYNVTRSLRRTLLYGNSNVANSALELIV